VYFWRISEFGGLTGGGLTRVDLYPQIVDQQSFNIHHRLIILCVDIIAYLSGSSDVKDSTPVGIRKPGEPEVIR